MKCISIYEALSKNARNRTNCLLYCRIRNVLKKRLLTRDKTSRRYANKMSVNQEIHSTEETEYFNPYGCGRCGQRFSNPIQLDNHVFVNHAEKTDFKCYHCSKITVNEKSLKSHILAKHKLQHCCYSFCNMPYKHVRRYLKFKQYVCLHCHKSFYRWKDLNVHMNIHQKPMRCKICGKKFSTRGFMHHHFINEHANEKSDWLLNHCCKNFKNEGAGKGAEQSH